MFFRILLQSMGYRGRLFGKDVIFTFIQKMKLKDFTLMSWSGINCKFGKEWVFETNAYLKI